ncbi:MAG: MATE family efflux transporter [Clostridia bacterium]|nr:MATE family efflux transporter [Clostridia bacterium]
MRLMTRDKSFYKNFISLLAFIAVQDLVRFSVNLADNFMLGAYQESAMSGAALANQIQFLLMMLIGGIGDGASVMGSQYWGTAQTGAIRKVASSALRTGLMISGFFAVAALVIPVPILSVFSNDAPIVRDGANYLRIMSAGLLLSALSGILLRVHQSAETVSLGVKVSVMSLFLNIGLNYIMIFGHFGFPEMGAAGAALATVISRAAEFAVIAVFTWKKDKKIQMQIKEALRIDKVLHKDFIRVSLPVILSGGSWGIAMCLQAVILGRMGPSAIGANAVATTLAQVLSVIVYASAAASGVITGKAVGRDDLKAVREYTRSFQVIFLCLGIVSCFAFQWVKPAILALYASSLQPETASLAGQFIDILSVTVIGTAYQMSCLTGIVRGGGHTKFVLYNDLIHMWGIVLPSSALCAFVFNLSPVVVFACLKSDQILKCIVAFFEVNSYRWIRKVTRDTPSV